MQWNLKKVHFLTMVISMHPLQKMHTCRKMDRRDQEFGIMALEQQNVNTKFSNP